MPSPLPPWPTTDPTDGTLRLRRFRGEDVAMVLDLALDPYVAQIGTLPARATPEQATQYLDRQGGRHAEGAGFAFCLALVETDRAVGSAALWLRELDAGLGSVGYSVAPRDRGHGYAAAAVALLVSFAASIDGLHRLQAFVEPWNVASRRSVERAGFDELGLVQHPRTAAEAPVPMLEYSLVLRPSPEPTNGTDAQVRT